MAADSEKMIEELRKISEAQRERARQGAAAANEAPAGDGSRGGGGSAGPDMANVAGAVAMAVGAALGPLIESLKDSLKESHAALVSLATGGGMERAFSGDLSAAAGSGFARHQAVAGDVSEIARRAAAAGVEVTPEQAAEWAERSAQTRRLEQQNLRAARQASGFAPGGLLEFFDDAVDYTQSAAYRLMGRERQAREAEMNAGTEGRR